MSLLYIYYYNRTKIKKKKGKARAAAAKKGYRDVYICLNPFASPRARVSSLSACKYNIIKNLPYAKKKISRV